jgi:transposase
MVKKIIFSNANKGFYEFYHWLEIIRAEHSKDKVIVGMEPTGHYWFCLAKFLRERGIKIAIVNPMHVKKSKELDDNSPTKNDPTAMDIREILIKELINTKVRLARWLDIYFPEFEEVFSSWEGKAALLILRNLSTPAKIAKTNIEDILKLWKTEFIRGVGIKRAQLLVDKAQTSIGVTEGLAMAEYKLQYLLDNYASVMFKLDELMTKVESILNEIPAAKKMLLIPGLGLVTVAGFLSEVCDLAQYGHPHQIQKLAGLTLKEYSSGKHKGQTTITKRGRRKLRAYYLRLLCLWCLIIRSLKCYMNITQLVQIIH